MHVVEYLTEKLRRPIVVHDRRADEVRLFEPPQFFAVRAVGGHRLHVAFNGFVDDVMDLVPQGVGTRKTAGAGDAVLLVTLDGKYRGQGGL